MLLDQRVAAYTPSVISQESVCGGVLSMLLPFEVRYLPTLGTLGLQSKSMCVCNNRSTLITSQYRRFRQQY